MGGDKQCSYFYEYCNDYDNCFRPCISFCIPTTIAIRLSPQSKEKKTILILYAVGFHYRTKLYTHTRFTWLGGWFGFSFKEEQRLSSNLNRWEFGWGRRRCAKRAKKLKQAKQTGPSKYSGSGNVLWIDVLNWRGIGMPRRSDEKSKMLSPIQLPPCSTSSEK